MCALVTGVQTCALPIYPGAAAFLFDSHGGGIDGGSGQAFDWSRIPAGLVKPVILAGGLGIDNVFDAIVRTLPWGVDVSSGVEASPGQKDGDRMREFVEQVRRADCHRSEEHTSELQSLMRISYAVFCLNKQNTSDNQIHFTH